jgi:lipopolysaccharide biosynthesis glycosyltransferase
LASHTHFSKLISSPGYWESIKPLKVIHYCSSPKPWQDAKKKGPLELQWYDVFMKSKGHNVGFNMFDMGF